MVNAKCWLYFIVLLISCKEISSEKQVRRVLSFGGNGMIGSAVLTRMISSGDYKITLVSRGNWHYDTKERIKPHVESVVCDRNKVPDCEGCSINALRHCDDLMKVLSNEAKFDVVLDFSAYQPKWVHDVVSVLKNKEVGVYVYISSDAVYEVSRPKPVKRLSIETDAIRPDDPKLREELNKADPYGNAKFGGEEVLVDQRKDKGGFPWLSFRYADVIGPRDNTRRFPFYHTWLKFYEDIGVDIYVPEDVAKVKESITYVEDAADCIMTAIERGPSVWDRAYNIAMEQEVNLEEILRIMANAMNVTITKTDGSNGNLHMYPTVFTGGIDIHLAKELLSFEPTDLKEAVVRSIKWYDDEFVRSFEYRESMISDLLARIVPRAKRAEVYLAVDRELSKAGVVDTNYRSKRKGDIENMEKFERIKPEL